MNNTITLTKTNFGTVFGRLYNSFLKGDNQGYIISPMASKKKENMYIESDEYKNQERVVYNDVNDLISDLHRLRSKAGK